MPRGARLGLVARRETELAEVARGLSGEPATYLADVADARAMHDAAQDFMRRFGVPDIVIANAGVSVGTLTEHPEDLAVFERLMRTNVIGLAATFQPFVAPMREARPRPPGRHRLGGRHARHPRRRRLQRLQVGRHHLSGIACASSCDRAA
jgi:NAD(P)-dependent dehydrogenase (short-subunit alcohol dehydrogenase family)